MQPPAAPSTGSAPPPVLVVALGGNAITRAGDEPSVAAQFARARATCEALVPIVASGRFRLVLTHGNGPQIGNILLRSDLAAEAGELPRLPLDTAVSDTQGGMGYMLQQCLANALWEAEIHIPVVTVVTQVIVDEDDPAFAEPTKPIGAFYPADKLAAAAGHGWTMRRDPGGRGFRRVVPSPRPKEIVEERVVRELTDAGVIVIACGGGGIPVVLDESGGLRGVDAVIDKDLASALLANHVGAEVFMILTDVDRVYLDHGQRAQLPLAEVDAASLAAYHAAGHFPGGSMGPKVEAVIEFLQRGGARAIVTSVERAEEALDGRAGTHVAAALDVPQAL